VQIQRAYRGYKTRRKIALFQKLPSELWNKVLYYTRYQHNIQTKYRKSVLDVHVRKILKIRNYYNANFYNVSEHDINKELCRQSLMTAIIAHGRVTALFDNNELVLV